MVGLMRFIPTLEDLPMTFWQKMKFWRKPEERKEELRKLREEIGTLEGAIQAYRFANRIIIWHLFNCKNTPRALAEQHRELFKKISDASCALAELLGKRRADLMEKDPSYLPAVDDAVMRLALTTTDALLALAEKQTKPESGDPPVLPDDSGPIR